MCPISAQKCTEIKHSCTVSVRTCTKSVYIYPLKRDIARCRLQFFVRISDVSATLWHLSMYCAGNEAVSEMQKSFFFQSFDDIIHGRRAGVQHFGQASDRTMPAAFTQLFRLRQAVDVCVYCCLGQLELHFLKHPRLNYKIKTLCHIMLFLPLLYLSVRSARNYASLGRWSRDGRVLERIVVAG